MKKSFIILLCISMPCCLLAQESLTQVPAKRNELGLTFRNLDSFGVTFRTGTEKAVWRFNTIFIGGSSFESTADSVYDKQSNSGISIQAGKEFRKLMANNFELRFGVDVSFSYSKNKSEYSSNESDYFRFSERITYTPGLSLIFGLNYVLNSNLVIGAELLPTVSYSTGSTTETDSYTWQTVKSDVSGFSYGLSNSSVLLSLAYRF